MRVLISVLVITMFCGCVDLQDIKGDHLRVGLNDCYQIDTNEVLIDNTQLESYYMSFYQLGGLTFPVNRVLESESVKTFIAISLNSTVTVENIVELHKKESRFNLLSVSNNNLLLKSDSLFNARFVRGINESIYIINIISTDSILVKKCFENPVIIDEKLSCTF